MPFMLRARGGEHTQERVRELRNVPVGGHEDDYILPNPGTLQHHSFRYPARDLAGKTERYQPIKCPSFSFFVCRYLSAWVWGSPSHCTRSVTLIHREVTDAVPDRYDSINTLLNAFKLRLPSKGSDLWPDPSRS
jgi:hypothetical protein